MLKLKLHYFGHLMRRTDSLEKILTKKGNAKECSNYRTIALISHASKVMLKILQARLQQYMNCELPDVQAGFRKGRGTRDQIAIDFPGHSQVGDPQIHGFLFNQGKCSGTTAPHLQYSPQPLCFPHSASTIWIKLSSPQSAAY